MDKYIKALGDWVVKPGKERVVYSGTYTDPSGNSTPVTITKQLPGYVRVEFSGGPVLLFDGSQASSSKNSLAQADLDILETLALDTGEGFFEQLQNSGAVRKLGEAFPLPGVKGSSYDVFELEAPLRTATVGKRVTKHFWFDNSTGKLARVQHFDGAPGAPAIATVISGWATIAGQAVPSRIQIYQGASKVAHSFAITGSTTAAYGPVTTFQQP